MKPGVLLICFLIFMPAQGSSQENAEQAGHDDHQMLVDQSGVVMNENHSTLPRNCTEISRDYNLTIHAGRKYAADVSGVIFGLSQHEIRVQPCSRVTITFVNEDQVRHQWMLHGLPKYLYPAGMFHIEASGGQSRTGTFIVPADEQTYLVHCDMAQHMEKGMRGQLVVGAGSGDLWAVPGISDQFYRFSYLPWYAPVLLILVVMGSLLISLQITKKP